MTMTIVSHLNQVKKAKYFVVMWQGRKYLPKYVGNRDLVIVGNESQNIAVKRLAWGRKFLLE